MNTDITILFIATLLFLVLSSPYMYVSKSVCPAFIGLFIRTLVYGVVIYIVLSLIKVKELFALRGMVDLDKQKLKEQEILQASGGFIPGGLDVTIPTNY